MLALVLAAMFVNAAVAPSLVDAQPPLNGGGGWSSYPDPNFNSGITGQDSNGQIAPNPGWSSLADVTATFNNARVIENADICPTGTCEPGASVMPTTLAFPADWATRSPQDKALWLLNSERAGRGLLPFEGIDPAVQAVSQAWAQHLIDTDTFAHNANRKAQIEAACTGCVGTFGTPAENIYTRTRWSTATPPLLDDFGVERAIYGWMYDDYDNGNEWGHRHALLWNDMSNDHGPAGSEGFIGLGIASVTTYEAPFNKERQVVVWNAIDSNSTYPAIPAPGYVALSAPCPVYDSTSATGGLAGAFNGGEIRTVTITGPLNASQGVGTGTCVPSANVSSVLVSIMAKNPQASGNLRLSAAGVSPTGGVVNYANNGLNNTNTVTVELSAAGAVDIGANGGAAGAGSPSTDVRISVLGYFSTTSGASYYPLVPCTVADSRSTQGSSGAFQGPFGPGANYPDVDVVGPFNPAQGGGNGGSGCGVPSTATSVVANLVAVNPASAAGTLSAGTGGTNPQEPALSFAPIGMNNAAMIVVPLSGQDKVGLDIDGAAGASVNVRMVVLGYFAPTGGDTFSAVTACAAFDTRATAGAAGAFLGKRDGGSTTTYQISGASLPASQGGQNSGSCAIPSGAKSVVINLIAVNSAAPGNLRVYATGTTPQGGALNFANLAPAMNNANAVIVPLSTGGQLNVDVNTGASNIAGATDVRGVVVGYFD